MKDNKKKYIENWLKNNSPRTKLTELEKNFDFNECNINKYYPYSIPSKHGEIYRIRKYRPYERLLTPLEKMEKNKRMYRLLCFYAHVYEFNILGYTDKDLKDINKELNLYFSVK